MALFKREHAGHGTRVDEVGQGEPATGRSAATTVEHDVVVPEHAQLLRERDELVLERDHLRGELEAVLEEKERLDTELARYRAQAQRLSTLLLRAGDYAAWVRENARGDAELALRKARARADEILGSVVQDRKRADAEIVRLQGLANETRARLKEFTLDALRLLDAPDEPETEADQDMEDALQQGVATARGTAAAGTDDETLQW